MTKELEALERIKKFYPTWRLSNREAFNIVEKALKALEIIKEKQVDVAMILSCEDADDYNRWCDSGASWSNEHITQQEYAILKEVFL
jgi:hypothetical protein